MALNNPVMSGPVDITDDAFVVVLDVMDTLVNAEYQNLFFYNSSNSVSILVVIDGDEDHAMIIPPSASRSFTTSDGVTVTRNVSAKAIGSSVTASCYFEMWQTQ